MDRFPGARLPAKLTHMTDADDAAGLLQLHGPGDLLEMIPYLLGFHPRDSLVIVGLDGRRVGATARIDLRELDTPDHLARALRVVADNGATTAVAAIYDVAAAGVVKAGLPHRRLVTDLIEHADRHGPDVCDVLLVADGTWWSYLCRDDQCCPPTGRPLPGDSSPAAAAAIYAGLVALDDREDLAASLTPDDDDARGALRPLIDKHEHLAASATARGHGPRRERSVKRAIFAAARDADTSLFVGVDGGISDENACRYAVALSETVIRDAVWLAVDQGRLDGRRLWQAIARRVPAPYDAAPLFLFGWASWRAGNGPAAGLAADRALVSDPAYTAAELLLAALAHGLDPRRTPRLRVPKPA